MKRAIELFTTIIFFASFLFSCAVQSELPPALATEEPDPTPTPIAREVDYIDVYRNPDEYDGEFISVAGQITNFSSNNYSLYFNDRLGQDEDGIGFEIAIEHTPRSQSVKEIYSIGDFIVVEGIWHTGIYKSLRDAVVTHTGKDAEKAATKYLNTWIQERLSLAESEPILNYMEVIPDIDSFTDEYVRIAGVVASTGTNKATHHLYFCFRDIYTNRSILDISLKGCPKEMQDICQEGDYIILSGKITATVGGASLSDCYVECVGESAKEAYDAVMSGQSTPTLAQPTPTPEPAPQLVQTWVLNTNTMKIHYPSCSSVAKIAAKNYATTEATVDELLARGYTKCGICF